MRRGQPKPQPSWPNVTWPSVSSSRRAATLLAPSGETWDFVLPPPFLAPIIFLAEIVAQATGHSGRCFVLCPRLTSGPPPLHHLGPPGAGEHRVRDPLWRQAPWGHCLALTLCSRSSRSLASRQLCSAGSLASACACPSAASLPMGSGRTGTPLSSTCSQPLEKLQVSP